MTEREQAKFFISSNGAGCPIETGESCADCVADGCGGSSARALTLARAWLADHPETPAKSEPIHKSASRGESSYSLSLADGRITLYHWHGQDSESMDFSGTADDLGQFDETRPEEWFDVAAKMIAGRK